MTAGESHPESKERHDALSASWKGPWANKWCMSSESYPGMELANQARFERPDDSDFRRTEQDSDRRADDSH